MRNKENKKAFWTTLPGILTGCAALITAIGGIIVVIIVSEPTPVVTPPPKPVINSFTASPSTISAGEISRLSWSVSDAIVVTLDQGIGRVALTGTKVVSPAESTTYTLTAENEAGSVTAKTQVIVEVGKPIIDYFIADPSSISAGESLTLSWSVSDATRVTIDHGIGGVALTGTRVVSPAETLTYTLTAENEAGSVDATIQVTVKVGKPVIDYFIADPSTISAGEISTLSWSVSDATHVTIDHGIGEVALTGTRMVSPIENITYTLTAENEAGSVDATIQVTVEVSNPVIVGDPRLSQIGNHTPPTFDTTSMIFALNATDNDSGIAEGMFNPAGGFAVSVWGYNEHFGGFYLFGDTTNGNIEEDFSLIFGSNDAGQVGRYRLMADVNANNTLRWVDPSKGYYLRIVDQNGEVTFIGAGGQQFNSKADVQSNTILFGSDTIGP